MAKEKPKDGEKTKEPKEPKEEKKIPIPQTLEVDITGENGEYTFGIQVISDKKTGIEVMVRILEGNKVSSTKPTAKNGFVEYKAQAFTEYNRTFKIRVLGTELDYQTTLPGPKQERKKKIKIKPDIEKGFTENFLMVWNAKKGETT